MTEFETALKKYAQDMGITDREAKEDAEATIQKQMEKEHVSREFAENTWIEDVLDADVAVIDAITDKAKKNGTDKVKARKVDAYGKKSTRERKENPDKLAVMGWLKPIFENLLTEGEISSLQIVNAERQIDFNFGDFNYSLVLTQHRKPKTSKTP